MAPAEWSLMVNLSSLAASDSDTGAALATLESRLDPHAKPAFICAFYDADHDDRQIAAFLKRHFPDAAVIGGTSCGA